jgi:hypothetical protein
MKAAKQAEAPHALGCMVTVKEAIHESINVLQLLIKRATGVTP